MSFPLYVFTFIGIPIGLGYSDPYSTGPISPEYGISLTSIKIPIGKVILTTKMGTTYTIKTTSTPYGYLVFKLGRILISPTLHYSINSLIFQGSISIDVEYRMAVTYYISSSFTNAYNQISRSGVYDVTDAYTPFTYYITTRILGGYRLGTFIPFLEVYFSVPFNSYEVVSNFFKKAFLLTPFSSLVVGVWSGIGIKLDFLKREE